MRRPRDSAVSDTIGVVLMVVIAVAMAGAVWMFVGGSAGGSSTPPAIGLVQKDTVNGGTASYTVASVSGAAKWSDIAMSADGSKLSYDSALSGGAKFCVQDGGASCVPTAAWDPTTLVKAGQVLYVHDPGLDFGSKFNVIHSASNTAIAVVKVK